MDALIAAAGRALAVGDTLGALNRVALRNDPPALALRGIAMARLGELTRSRELLRRAARGFGSHEALARARCIVAEAEVALAMRDLDRVPRSLAGATAVLDAHGDRANALQARLIEIRRLLLVGRIGEAEAALAGLGEVDGSASGGGSGGPVGNGMRLVLPPSLRALTALIRAEVALRSLRTAQARDALATAEREAARAGLAALQAEVAGARAMLQRPAARLRQAGGERSLRVDEVEAVFASDLVVLDACRRGLRARGYWLSLARRPILFGLARALAEASPGDVDRNALIARVFRTRDPDETHRVRLRVEIARLRALVAGQADLRASPRGFSLVPHGGRALAVLVPPIDGDAAFVQALLADGSAWSTSALALALGDSQRTVQRMLAELEAAGRVRAIGRARARRWLAPPVIGFTTILLLPAAPPAP
ncbi:MAG: helix-turn-helix domain-containing protein [Burkholderiaceae bacterium]